MGLNKLHPISQIPCVEKIKEALTLAMIDAQKNLEDLGMCVPQEYFENLTIGKGTKHKDDDEDDNENEKQTEKDVQIISIENSINQEDFEEEEDTSIFNEMDKLNIKDFSGEKLIEDKSVLSLKIKEKRMLVKKTTLCWFFSKKKHKQSSDRILRVRDMGSSTIKKNNGKETTLKRTGLRKVENEVEKHCEKPTKPKKQESSSSSETDTESEYSIYSEYEKESSDAEEGIEESVCLKNIIEENNYAVCYREDWYVGRVIKKTDQFCQIKFLKNELNQFVWPKFDDIQQVETKFIFYGPVQLLGNGPFDLSYRDKLAIEKKYKTTKQELKDYL